VNNKLWKNKKKISASLSLLASPMQHKQYSDNVNDNSDNYFLLVNKSYWSACASQTDSYIFSSEYHNQLTLVSISSGSWCEFHTEILKCIVE
jgi:hypothetical protein